VVADEIIVLTEGPTKPPSEYEQITLSVAALVVVSLSESAELFKIIY
jgi:hypothetical protein